MSNYNFTTVLMWLEPALCLLALAAMYRRSLCRDYNFLTWYLIVRALADVTGITLLSTYSHSHIERHLHYHIYWWVYTISLAVEVCLGFGLIYNVYDLAMAPLPGLQRLGRVMFRWAAGISLALSLAMAVGPRISATHFLTRTLGELQQSESVLTLCMLLFVCVTVSPMGLSVRSKIFGVCLGFGVNAAAQLVVSAWFGGQIKFYSLVTVLSGLAICLSLSIWTVYFVLPDPKRRLIVLPTTSPFLRWNQISAALGDEPGFVALGVVTQDMFAPAEVEIMRRASAKMNQAYGD